MSPSPAASLTNSDAPSKRPPTPAKDLEYGRPSRPTTQQTHYTQQPSQRPSNHRLRSSRSSSRRSSISKPPLHTENNANPFSSPTNVQPAANGHISTLAPPNSLPNPTHFPGDPTIPIQEGNLDLQQPDPNTLPFNHLHPCYPHQNTHVPLTSPLTTSTRLIRIPRDWEIAGDMAPTFSEVYPEILAPWVSEQDFRTLINGVNARLIAIFAPGGKNGVEGLGGGMYGWRQILDVLLGVLSGWITEDLGLTAVKGGLRDVEGFVERWNGERRMEGGAGLGGIGGEKGDEGEDGEVAKCVPLRRTGYLSLDIQVPDPNLERVVEESVNGSVNGAGNVGDRKE
ncbi:uncharacterized protein KY384_003857 [Bacidia gigantensis]|uniref:uncharacterized protein n=1 Tax=Bacidia gigantensis TaxID=2732470 RepID=UPI001D03E81B|nr:uncharacterized protein KY384_003857 [Bacidia gigantensis]KAG8532216.1 hypothetical protein KY384_003857 [Bacidia gigantensis]